MKIVFLTFSILVILSCKEPTPQQEKYPRHLGDIAFDPSVDDPKFELCFRESSVYQYFNLGNNIEIMGDKPYLEKMFVDNYDSTIVKKESGLVRIRFIVNCKGEADRFRITISDLDYKEIKMDSNISDQLMTITKSLKGWKQKYRNTDAVDYYQYLVFRIIDGQIVKILP